MSKFNRLISKKLLAENKFNKYLIYAIGEIVLVVVGILIALSVNNWNQNNIERKNEILILTELTTDLEEQVELFNDFISLEHKLYQHGKDLLGHFAQNQTFFGNDSVYSKINALITRKTFNSVNTTFQELISTGTIGIIQDRSIKREIIHYYHELERVSLVISNNNTNIVDGIYQSEVLKKTLFVLDETDPRLQEFNDQIFNKNSLGNIRATSKKILTTPEINLHLFNLIEQRTLLAISHKESYQELLMATNELLRSIKSRIGEKE